MAFQLPVQPPPLAYSVVKRYLTLPLSLFIILCVVSVTSHAAAENFLETLRVDFEKSSAGIYTEKALHQDFTVVDWSEGLERTRIVEDADTTHRNTLEVLYPKGAVGPRVGGAQFIIPLKPSEQYVLSYDFRLSNDFDFRRGGKLPGLTSGGSKYTGGHKPDQGQGWSARFMWREKGQMVLYLYSIDMRGKWGDNHLLDMPSLERGRWYHLKQSIRLNVPGSKDARIQVWVDGESVLDLQNIRLRIGDQGQIDTFYFSTFFGGNTADWGPHNDSRIRFDNFEVAVGN